MNFSKTKFLIVILPLVAIGLLFVSFIIFPLSKYPLESDADNSTQVTRQSTGNVGEGASSYLVDSISYEVPINSVITLPEGYELDLTQALPVFITVVNNQLVINATKTDIGDFQIYLNDPLSDLFNETFYLNLNLKYKSIDEAAINNQIQAYLGSQSSNYGYFIYDLNRNISFGNNSDTEYRAASMVKVPIAITIMREIQEDRLSLDTVYPLRSDLIFNYTVGAGENPVGTPLTIRDYLNYMIKESDNTSLSHLDAILSDVYGSNLNSRIKDITGVEFYVNPPEATPRSVATVLKGLYSASFLNRSNSDYIINLMKNALPDLKEGLGLGLPNGVEFANKIGFLDTTEDLSFMDSAIIYGATTDYVVVIMDKNQDWDFAQNNLKNISSIIYNNLN